MGQKDTVTKDYIRNAEVFADAFNYLFYGGEKVIIPESLHELDSTATTIIHDDSLNAESVSYTHLDVYKRQDKGLYLQGLEDYTNKTILVVEQQPQSTKEQDEEIHG